MSIHGFFVSVKTECVSPALSPDLTHCGLMTPYGSHTLVTIGSGNGLAPKRCQAIT